MKAEDLQVQKALIVAGFGDQPATNRGELHETLAQILKKHPVENDDFVDLQRTILSDAQRREDQAEYELVKALHPFVKGCPECGREPDVERGYWSASGQKLVVCMNHTDGAVTRAGVSLAAAVESWNSDDWISPGQMRKQFPL